MGGVHTSPEDIKFLRIRIASPDTIREWGKRPKGSYETQSKFDTSKHPGRVVSEETFDYKGLIPKMGGLFCQRNFGPVVSLNCACGNARVSHVQKKTALCELCGVELISSRVRRSRMGYVELARPVVHPLWLLQRPSKVGALLCLNRDQLIDLAYNGGKLWATIEGRKVAAGRGVKHYLQSMDDVPKHCHRLRGIIARLRFFNRPKEMIDMALRSLRVLEQFRSAKAKPSWMVLDALPVLPPGLRPLFSFEGEISADDVNSLYKRVISRNNRLRSLLSKGGMALFVVRMSEKVLQLSVDRLMDNKNQEEPVVSSDGTPLVSLMDVLGGKEGLFRQNLLGKRVDFSGRSVIVSGPQLTLNQCGLPIDMAVELFQPQLSHVLMFLSVASTVSKCREILSKRLQRRSKEAVAEFFSARIVILNRAPTLHLFGMRAFFVCLSQQLAISVNPLACTGFNADFDGDTMAVHVPLSLESQLEAMGLIPGNSGGHGHRAGFDARVVVTPSQDMVIGLYVAGAWDHCDEGEDPLNMEYFFSFDDAVRAYSFGTLSLNEKICVRCDPDYAPQAGERVEYRMGGQTVSSFLNGTIQKKGPDGEVERTYVITSPGRCLLTQTLNGHFLGPDGVDWPPPGTKV
jgi:DNA-directed RNA polymerase subunit beta'